MKHLESFASNLPVAVAVYNLQTGEYRFVTKEIESIIGHSVALSEVSTKLNNLISNLG